MSLFEDRVKNAVGGIEEPVRVGVSGQNQIDGHGNLIELAAQVFADLTEAWFCRVGDEDG